MSDGPNDYDKGYFFESQKGISDNRAALGLDQGRSSSASSNRANAAGSVGAELGILAFKGFGWIAVSVAQLSFMVLKEVGGMIFSRRRRR